MKQNRTKKALDRSFERDFKEIRDGSRDRMSTPAREYMEAVIDPKRSKSTGIPTLMGGEPGWTATTTFTTSFDVKVGTAGYGFLAIGDRKAGFYNNRAIATYSSNSSTFTTSEAALTSATAGVSSVLFSRSPYTTLDNVAYRLVGLSVEFTPDTAVLDQNGKIIIYEFPSHNGTATETQYNVLATRLRKRIIRNVIPGDARVKYSLNLHPRYEVVGTSGHYLTPGESPPFSFLQFTDTSVTGFASIAGVIAISATEGTSLNCEINAMYEYRGDSVLNTKPRLTDSRGMDLALNTFRMKKLSGWVGVPHDVASGYWAHLWDVFKQEGQSVVLKAIPKIVQGSVHALKSVLS